MVLFGVWYNIVASGTEERGLVWFSLWGVVLRQRLLFTVLCLPFIPSSYTCNASFG